MCANPARSRAGNCCETGLRWERDHGGHTFRLAREGTPMPDKSPQKSNEKKQGKSLKEKRSDKKLKKEVKSSQIPSTGH
jgi:hypothetical protein